MKELFLSAKNLSLDLAESFSLSFPSAFSISTGKIYALIGPSGSGKTTFSKLLTGYLKPTTGTLSLDRFLYHKPFHRIQLIHQNPVYSFTPHLTLRTFFNSILKPAQKEQFFYYLNSLNLSPDHLSCYPDQLSGGEAQRFAFIRSLIHNPHFIFCDEITSNLDRDSKSAIYRLLNEFRVRNRLGVIWISHDLDEIYEFCNSILLIRQGRVLDLGDELLKKDKSIFISTLMQFFKDNNN